MLHHRACILAASILFALPVRGQAGSLAFQEAKLTASGGAVGGSFGRSVAVSGDTAIVGAAPDDSVAGESGSAYVYVRVGTLWTQQVKLTASDAASGDDFGVAVAVSGDTAVVGAYEADHDGMVDAGSAYVFIRTGTTWTQQAKLTASDGASGDRFGVAVAIDGDTATIGALFNDHDGFTDAGSAYVFVRSGTNWTQQAQLTASDPSSAEIYFGDAVAVSGDTVIVGAKSDPYIGSAYVFIRTGTIWSQQAKLTAPDVLSGDIFGISVAASGDTVVVGSNQIYNFGTGAAYVFARTGTTWAQQAKLTASDGKNGDQFGDSVSLSGGIAVVGADAADLPGQVDAGSAYVFVRTGEDWVQEAKLTASDSAAGDRCGLSAAIESDTVVLGAPYDDAKGSAYVFRVGPFGDWTDLRAGLAGAVGVPVLTGAGFLLKDLPVTLSLSQAKQFSLAPLVVGVNTIFAPFKGGTMVPAPTLFFVLTTDFFGKSSFGGLWPPGVPSGFTTYFQWWIQDAAGPKGFAASNALAGTTP